MSLKLTLVHPKELNDELFQSIRGSEMHATMVRNRIDVFIDLRALAAEHIVVEIKKWLENSCKSAFHVKKGPQPTVPEGKRYACTVYIEGENDAATFRLFMHDKEIEDPPPPPMPKTVPTVPSTPSSKKPLPRKINISNPWQDLADLDEKRRWAEHKKWEEEKKEKELLSKIADRMRKDALKY